MNYADPAIIEDLRRFHLHIGKLFDANKANYYTQEEVVAKLLRCEVGLVLAKLSRKEEEEWRMALARKEPDFVDDMGWILSKDIPALLKPHFGPTFDYPAFQAFWSREVPGYTVVDIDRKFLDTRKSWVDHIVSYLHHVELFYKKEVVL
jgi:hypothetical protein